MSVGGGAAAVIAEHAPRLTTLVMANVGGVDDTAVESIGKLAALRQLQIDFGDYGDAGVMAIARGCRALRTLVLFESRMSVLGARAIAAQLQQLVVFRADMCRIDDAAARAIASLGSLEALFVSVNRIGDAGARALAAHDRLKTLDVGENRIGDEGEECRCTRCIVALASRYRIRSRMHPVFRSLTDSTPLPRLHHANGAGALALVRMRSLSKLGLFGNQISPAVRRQLAEQISKASRLPRLELLIESHLPYRPLISY